MNQYYDGSGNPFIKLKIDPKTKDYYSSDDTTMYIMLFDKNSQKETIQKHVLNKSDPLFNKPMIILTE